MAWKPAISTRIIRTRVSVPVLLLLITLLLISAFAGCSGGSSATPSGAVPIVSIRSVVPVNLLSLPLHSQSANPEETAASSYCSAIEEDSALLNSEAIGFANAEAEVVSDGCAAYSADDVSSLYLTFLRGNRVRESVHIGPVTTPQGTISLTDIALSPSGALWGIDDTSALYRIDPVTAAARYIGLVGAVVNGLVVGTDGTIYASGFQSLYTINPTTGAGTRIGQNTGFGSEGDLAFSSNGVLYMSATGNVLVRLNTSNGIGTEIGQIGYSNVFGLGFSIDTLYGETAGSQLITIDPATGAGTLVVSDDGVASNGMAVPTTVSSQAGRWLSPVATALATPHEAFSSITETIVNGVITAGIVVFITFPAQIFNATLDENYAEILAMWRRFMWRLWRKRHRPASKRERSPSEVRKREFVALSTVVVVGSIVGGFRDPSFGFNLASVANFLGTVLCLVVLIAVPAAVAVGYRWVRRKPTHFIPRAIPAGLPIAVFSVVVSRLTHFEPGYLYGLVCGIAFAHKLVKSQEAFVVTFESLATLAVSVAAWLAFVPVDRSALEPGSGFGVALLDDFLASVLVGGLVGIAIGMLPLRFLPGGTVYEWSRKAWAAMFGIAMFGIVAIMLRPSAGPVRPGAAPIVTTIVLFVVFGGVSLLFRQYFARRHGRRDEESRVTAPTGLGRIR